MALKNNNLPQYKQLYELLRKHILDSVYEEGSILPSENELSKIHDLTRPTVRRALDALVNDGYIEKHQGKGSIVLRKHRELGIMSIEGVTKALGENLVKTNIIVKPDVGKWIDPFPYLLTEKEKAYGCIYMERLRLVDDKPVFYDKNFIPNINLPRFCTRNFENKSLFGILRDNYQLEIKGGEQKLRALPADKKMVKYLNVKEGHPILQLVRKLTTNHPEMNIYSFLFCNTDEFSLHGLF
jgi:GntR family transcriptional regulator/GntR family frlABCD operon transcriptional regulator